MFHKRKEEQLRALQLDGFIGSVTLTSSGGHPSGNSLTEEFEAQRQAIEDRLRAEIALESTPKK
jgi:hypothetical protein